MIYVCEYDNSTSDQILLDAAQFFYQNENILTVKEEDKTGMRWKKLRERILAWMLLEYALRVECEKWIKDETCESYGSIVDQLRIERTEHGKPYSGRYPELFFNISHCDTACACVISDCPVGIDIERKFEYKENLKRHVCCEEELRTLESFNDDGSGKELCALESFNDDGSEKELRALECFSEICYGKDVQLRFLWSMKEAFVKLDGRGLGYGLKKINFAELIPVKDGVCSLYRHYGDSGKNNSVDSEVNNSGNVGKSLGETMGDLVFLVKGAENYTLAACSRQDNLGEVHVVSERELMKLFSSTSKLKWT